MPKGHGKSVANWKRTAATTRRYHKPVPVSPVSRWLGLSRGPAWDDYIASLVTVTKPADRPLSRTEGAKIRA